MKFDVFIQASFDWDDLEPVGFIDIGWDIQELDNIFPNWMRYSEIGGHILKLDELSWNWMRCSELKSELKKVAAWWKPGDSAVHCNYSEMICHFGENTIFFSTLSHRVLITHSNKKKLEKLNFQGEENLNEPQERNCKYSSEFRHQTSKK